MTDHIGYEAARAELSDVVRKLETGGQTLEESLALWERGEVLADVCQRWLEGANARLERAMHGVAERDDADHASDHAGDHDGVPHD